MNPFSWRWSWTTRSAYFTLSQVPSVAESHFVRSVPEALISLFLRCLQSQRAILWEVYQKRWFHSFSGAFSRREPYCEKCTRSADFTLSQVPSVAESPIVRSVLEALISIFLRCLQSQRAILWEVYQKRWFHSFSGAFSHREPYCEKCTKSADFTLSQVPSVAESPIVRSVLEALILLFFSCLQSQRARPYCEKGIRSAYFTLSQVPSVAESPILRSVLEAFISLFLRCLQSQRALFWEVY